MSLSKENFLLIISAEIEELFGIIIPEHTEQEKISYTLSRAFFGIYQKRLYVYFVSGRAVNYKVHYFLFNRKMV